MAKTVGLTTGIAVRHYYLLVHACIFTHLGSCNIADGDFADHILQASVVLDGNLTARGVLTPVLPEIYLPGLERLAAEGLCFEENEL